MLDTNVTKVRKAYVMRCRKIKKQMLMSGSNAARRSKSKIERRNIPKFCINARFFQSWTAGEQRFFGETIFGKINYFCRLQPLRFPIESSDFFHVVASF